MSVTRRRRGRRSRARQKEVGKGAEEGHRMITRGRAAAATVVEEESDAAAVVVEEESHAAIYISSDSDAESADSGSEEDEEEVPSSEEDYIVISDGGESYIEISDSEDDDDGEEGSCEGDEGEAEAGQPAADRSEAACTKIADLLRQGRNLDKVKLVECKAYLKKNGLSQVGDMTTCVERIMLHWRFKEDDPEKIYPRSSFSINCKGDVCRGDSVLFKQKVHEKSGKRHSKCISKRIVAGKVIKESYGKEKQQHTFTIQVFWSRGVGKLPPLYLLLVKGRNLYRMMTFRQPWQNEADRSKALEEKHSRGDAARRVRALNRQKSRRHVLKGKKSMEKGKHQPQLGRPDGGSRITKCKKRVMQSSNSDLPAKKSRKEEDPVSSEPVYNHLDSTELRVGKRKAGSKQKNTVGSNLAQFEGKRLSSACHLQAHRGSLVGINQPLFERHQRPPPLREVGNVWQPCMDSNHAQFEGKRPSSACHSQAHRGNFVGINQSLFERHQRLPPLREVGNAWQPCMDSNHAQFEGKRPSSACHSQAHRGNLVGINQPLFERQQRPPPLREVGNAWIPCMDDRPIAYPNPTMAFEHPNAAVPGWGAPPPSQPGVVFTPFNVSCPHPKGAYVTLQHRYSGGSNGFPR